MTHWLSEIPSWLSFAICVLGANAVACGMAFFYRRWALRRGITGGPAVVNSWATVVGAFCSLLFAFTIVTLWNTQRDVHRNLDEEAAAIRMVSRDLAPSQVPLLRSYVDLTITEWANQCDGRELVAVTDALAKLETLAKPRSDSYADDLYRQLGSLEDMRNRRWQTATSSVPNEIWIGLIGLSLALFVVLAIAQPDYAPTHYKLIVAAAVSVGSLIWIATVLQYPFCGSAGIAPDEIRSIATSHLL